MTPTPIERLIAAARAVLVSRSHIIVSPELDELAAACSALLLALPQAPLAQVWIPCSERMPEYGKSVFICRYGTVTNGFFYTEPRPHFDSGGHRYWTDTGGVTHWMPCVFPNAPSLPTPPAPPAKELP